MMSGVHQNRLDIDQSFCPLVPLTLRSDFKLGNAGRDR